MATGKGNKNDPEIVAITGVYEALKSLDADAQQRVIDYVSRKLHLVPTAGMPRSEEVPAGSGAGGESFQAATPSGTGDADLEGISPVAQKWMKRNGLRVDQLSTLFSLGVDEIDLVAKKVPGRSKPDKVRSVFLLKGVAAYLSSGTPRVSFEQIREACTHYDAFDTTNFSKHVKALASEVSGTKESGFTLTARGLTEATDLIKKELPIGANG